MARLDDRSSDEPVRWTLTPSWRDRLYRVADLALSASVPFVMVLVTMLLLHSYCR